ncbi:unnamed protein product [Urochloa humidicola]
MATPRARFLACIAVAAVALLAPLCTGERRRRCSRAIVPGERDAVRDDREAVHGVGAVHGRDSTFQHALTRAFPSYSLVVDNNPALGDFTTIQDAIDSLPAINLVRVVIRVNAGTYTYIKFCTQVLANNA